MTYDPAPLPDNYWDRRGIEPPPDPDICTVCGVDHMFAWADLSHGNIHLIIHAQERSDWMAERGSPINGDMIARQRAGILPKSLLFSSADPEEIDWTRVKQAHPPTE